MNPVLSILSALHYLNDGVRTSFVSLLPFIAKDLHLSFTQVGALSASQGFMIALLSLPSGFLAMRFGGFRIIFLALLLYSLGAFAIGLAPNIWVLMLIFYLGSSGFGLFHVIANTLIVRNTNKTNRARYLATFSTFGDVGRISLPVVALFAASFLGWRETFFLVAGGGLLLFVIVQWILPLKKHIVHTHTTPQKQSYKEWLSDLPHLLKQKQFLLALAAATIDNIAASPIFVFLPFLILAKGFPVAMLGVFTAAYFIGTISGKNILAYGASKLGTAKVFMIAEIGMAATLLVFTLFNHVIVLLGLSILLGLFARGTTPIVATLFSEITHEDHYEKAYGFSDTVFGIGVILSPILMGMLADQAGVVTVFYASAVLAFLATIPIVFLLRSPAIQKVHLAPAVERE